MMRSKTIREQVLPVLKVVRTCAAGGRPTADACQFAIREVSKTTKVWYQTVLDGCTRRLGNISSDEFHRLVEAWVDGGSNELRDLLIRHSDTGAHAEIRAFFGEAGAMPTTYGASPETSRVRGLEEPRGKPPEPAAMERLILSDLAPETISALRQRAEMNRRSLESEIESILTRAAHAGREEFAAWAAGLRARMRGRPAGDATADIRADRDR